MKLVAKNFFIYYGHFKNVLKSFERRQTLEDDRQIALDNDFYFFRDTNLVFKYFCAVKYLFEYSCNSFLGVISCSVMNLPTTNT